MIAAINIKTARVIKRFIGISLFGVRVIYRASTTAGVSTAPRVNVRGQPDDDTAITASNNTNPNTRTILSDITVSSV